MIDLTDYALVSDTHDTAVRVSHLTCNDSYPVLNLDQALAWAGEHVCNG